MAAVMILMEYLTDTAVAPLQRDFVELTEPYCSEVKKFVKYYFNVYDLSGICSL
jgi:Zn-dependent M16 (insulinase) family peptidase